MKNKDLILLLAAAAAYYFLFMKKKPADIKIEQPGFVDQPGTAQPGQQQAQTAPAILTESVSIVDEIKNFSAPARELEYKPDGVFQTYYVNQVSGIKKMGVPFTI